MAPKNKFTREEMIKTALSVVRKSGMDKLTAKTLADALGTSTQPIFTCFGSMESAKKEVRNAAQAMFESYLAEGLRQYIPFFGYGMQYIRFAKEEPMLYRLLFLSDNECENRETISSMNRAFNLVRPSLIEIYHLTDKEAERFFRDVWLVAHSVSVLIVTGACAYSEEDIHHILTGSSVASIKAIKELPGYVDNTFDRDAVFGELVRK